MTTADHGVLLHDGAWFTVHRVQRHVVTTLQSPVTTLGTCACLGGCEEKVTHIVNHQSCEGAQHDARADFILGLTANDYHDHVCGELNLPPATTAVMGTAAHMQYTAIERRAFGSFVATAVVTAGVQGNAACAGDPAWYDEKGGAWERVSSTAARKEPGTAHGTINVILLLSETLSPSALARAALTLAEGKAAALQRLAVGSRSSWRLATGTGTDQYVIASPSAGQTTRTWTGHHCKAGEVIGAAVESAVVEALRWQNGLEASSTRSLIHALARFGVEEGALLKAMEDCLPSPAAMLLRANRMSVLHEPQSAAAAYALASVVDRILFGTLSFLSGKEALLNQLALVSASQASAPERWLEFRSAVVDGPAWRRLEETDALLTLLPQLVAEAIAQGWNSKWSR